MVDVPSSTLRAMGYYEVGAVVSRIIRTTNLLVPCIHSSVRRICNEVER